MMRSRLNNPAFSIWSNSDCKCSFNPPYINGSFMVSILAQQHNNPSAGVVVIKDKIIRP